MRVNVLGTIYTIREVERCEDKDLENANGYCDSTTKEIVIAKKDENSNLGNFESYRKRSCAMKSFTRFCLKVDCKKTSNTKNTDTKKQWLTGLPCNTQRCKKRFKMWGVRIEYQTTRI